MILEISKLCTLPMIDPCIVVVSSFCELNHDIPQPCMIYCVEHTDSRVSQRSLWCFYLAMDSPRLARHDIFNVFIAGNNVENSAHAMKARDVVAIESWLSEVH
jgi:hypothetical protein